jgi:hypothetical protein
MMETELTALLSSVAGGRRYWVRAPQGTVQRPYIVLQRASRLPNMTMSGPSGYVASRVQADIYGESFSSAKAAADALKSAVSGYRGGSIQGIFIDAERDMPEADAGEVSKLFRISIDLMIHFGEQP